MGHGRDRRRRAVARGVAGLLAAGWATLALPPAGAETAWCSPDTAEQAYDRLLAAAPDGGDVEVGAQRIADGARARGEFDTLDTLFELDDFAIDHGYLFHCHRAVYVYDPDAARSGAGAGPACGEDPSDEPEPVTDEPAMEDLPPEDGTESADETPVDDPEGDEGYDPGEGFDPNAEDPPPETTDPEVDPCAVEDGPAADQNAAPTPTRTAAPKAAPPAPAPAAAAPQRTSPAPPRAAPAGPGPGPTMPVATAGTSDPASAPAPPNEAAPPAPGAADEAAVDTAGDTGAGLPAAGRSRPDGEFAADAGSRPLEAGGSPADPARAGTTEPGTGARALAGGAAALLAAVAIAVHRQRRSK